MALTQRKRRLKRQAKRRRQKQIVREIQCTLLGHVVDMTDELGTNRMWDVLSCDVCYQMMYRGELDGRVVPGRYQISHPPL